VILGNQVKVHAKVKL